MPPKVPDYGHREADRKLSALIRRLHLSYRQARIGLQDKIEKYLEEFEKEDAEKRALYDSGELSHEEYTRWKYSTLAGTKQWKRMLNQLADDMTHQNEIAASMINDALPDVYALNHNYGTYEAEKGSGYDTTYTMYDKNTVKRLLTENEDLLPHPRVPIEKDKLWNRQHLQSALLQGILTGEPMGDIAKRFQSVTDMTENAAMRNARTAVTGAENAGRIDSYKRAVAMGIKMRQMWMSVHDGRTRDSHAIMDGEQQEVGELFSNGCRYPGDPHGAPAEVYNCRCRTKAVVEGSDAYENGYNPALRPSKYLQDRGLTYEQWKEMHGERFYSKLFKDVQDVSSKQQSTFHIAQGKDISDSLVRRPDKDDDDKPVVKTIEKMYNGTNINQEKAVSVFSDWASGEAYDIRFAQQNNYENDSADFIEQCIKESNEHFTGKLYRGIMADEKTAELYLKAKRLAEEGEEDDVLGIINMCGTSSWSSSESIAEEFSRKANEIGGLELEEGVKYTPIIFIASDNKYNKLAIDIDEFAGLEQKEVLVSKDAEFVPAHIDVRKDGTIIVYLDWWE